SAGVAVFRSMGAVEPPAASPAEGASPAEPDPAGAGAGTPTVTSSPSATFLARLSIPMSARGSGPPAALSTSMTRAPAGTVTTPGRRTFPLTATTSDVADADGAAEPTDVAPGTTDG